MVYSFIDLSTWSYINYALLYSIISASGIIRLSTYIKHKRLPIISFAIYDIAKSPALIDKVVTMSYVLALHTTVLSNTSMI